MARCYKVWRIELLDKACITSARAHFFFRDFVQVICLAIIYCRRLVLLIHNPLVIFFKFGSLCGCLFGSDRIWKHSTTAYINLTLACFLWHSAQYGLLSIASASSLFLGRRGGNSQTIFLALYLHVKCACPLYNLPRQVVFEFGLLLLAWLCGRMRG